MNSAHDLGGMHGFDPVDHSEQRHFPEEWERKVFGMTLACGMLGKWNLDQSRYARETMEPGHYLTTSYYEHWLHGLERLLVDKGLISKLELEDGKSRGAASEKAVPKEKVSKILRSGGPTLLPEDSPPLFSPGDPVTVANFHPKSHTRAPRYIRGHHGVVERYHGAHIFPDQHAASGEKAPAHLYCVRFEATELWGENDADHQSAVFVDVFEPYLKRES